MSAFIRLTIDGGKIIYIENSDKKYKEEKIMYDITDTHKNIIRKMIFEKGEKLTINAVDLDRTHYDSYAKSSELSFEIKNDNPIFKPIKNFLDGEKISFLNDDGNIRNKTKMEIVDDSNNIEITFKNPKVGTLFADEKFKIFIKENEYSEFVMPYLLEDNKYEKVNTLFQEIVTTIKQRDKKTLNNEIEER